MSDAAAKTPTDPKRPKKGRSPAYPAINLKIAIEKAKALYDAEGKYAAPMPSAFSAWGYGAKSSGGRDTRSALRYFGLIVIEGDGETGKVKLTEDALRVLLDERENQSEKKAIIRRMALNPAIHKKLLERFPAGIKSDATVEHYLVFEGGYNKSAAGEVVAEFKETADFAELFKPAMMSDKLITLGSENDQPQGSDEKSWVGGGADIKPPKDLPRQQGQQVRIMESERVVFTEEGQPSQYLKLIASGDVDDGLLEALEDYVKRQRKRLKAAPVKAPIDEANEE